MSSGKWSHAQGHAFGEGGRKRLDPALPDFQTSVLLSSGYVGMCVCAPTHVWVDKWEENTEK